MWTCVDEKNQGWCKTKDVKQAGETEIQQITRGGEREGGRRKGKRGGGGDKKTFKGVNSRRVTIPGAVSIPPWHSPDKSALLLLIRRGEKKWKEGGQRESAERKKDGTATAKTQRGRLHSVLIRARCLGKEDAVETCEASWSKDKALMCN